MTVVAEDLLFPNGSVITPDGGTLIVGETWGNRFTAFDLAPDGSGTGTGTESDAESGTRVTLTYDWSAVPPPMREEFGLPPFGPVFLEQSLEALDRALTGPPAG